MSSFICLNCGGTFPTTKTSKNMYCSYKCSNGAKKKSYECTCLGCGKIFTTNNKAEIGRGHKKYCSIDCKIRKYKIDENYFDNLNRSSKYWLGFLFSSSIIRNMNVIDIYCRNYEQLNSFLVHMNSTYPIRKTKDPKTKEQGWRITIRSYNIVNKLIEYGMTIKTPLKYSIENIDYDFIRGYIDSNNGFIYKELNTNTIVIHCKSIRLLTSINKVLGGKIYPNKKEWSLIIKESNHYKFIYDNEPVCDFDKKSKFIQ